MTAGLWLALSLASARAGPVERVPSLAAPAGAVQPLDPAVPATAAAVVEPPRLAGASALLEPEAAAPPSRSRGAAPAQSEGGAGLESATVEGARWFDRGPGRFAVRQAETDLESAFRRAALRGQGAPAADGVDTRIVADWRGVPSGAMRELRKLGRQEPGSSVCVRHAMAACATANGADVALDDVKTAAAKVIREEIRAEPARRAALPARAGAVSGRLMIRSGSVDGAQAAADRLAASIDPDRVPLDLLKERRVAQRLGLRMEELGEALSSRDAGEFASRSAGLRLAVEERLGRGLAVRIGIRSVSSPAGVWGGHAVTVLGVGRNAAGRKIAVFYDSAGGRLVAMPWDEVYPAQAIVFRKARRFSVRPLAPDGSATGSP